MAFQGNNQDLIERTAYEIFSLDRIRSRLFGESSDSQNVIKIDLTTGRDQDGNYRQDRILTSIVRSSADDVKRSLSDLRPLIFSSAFKLNDMIAEWILHNNGFNEWPFSKKLREYDRLRQSSALQEPHFFAQNPSTSNAFWDMYRKFVPFRGTVIHSSAISIREDFALRIDKNSSTLTFTDIEQATYVRLSCNLVRCLSGQQNDPMIDRCINNDYAVLSNHHNQASIINRPVFVQKLHLSSHSPTRHIGPAAILEINYDEIATSVQSGLPVGSNCDVLYELSVECLDGNRLLKWDFPIGYHQSGSLLLSEVDQNHATYLSIEMD